MTLRFLTFPAVAASLALVACGPSKPPAPEVPGQPSGNQVTGRERIGWDQAGEDASTVRAYSYWVYVDGVRSPLTGAECGSTAGEQGFSCSAPLPRLSMGQHTLELSAATGEGSGAAESTRSAPLVVVMIGTGLVVAATTGEQAEAAPGRAERSPQTFVTADGITLVVRQVAEVSGPTALRFAPDGRLFVAEQGGRIRVVADGRLLPDPALVLEDVVVGPTAGLLGMALDPDFDRTHHVYIIYTARRGEGIEKQVVRYREVGGRLGERAVLLSGIPATLDHDSAGLDVGPDGKLYIATGMPADVRRADRVGRLASQLLRLNPDGTTPRDNPSFSPIVLRSLRWPIAVVWPGLAPRLLVVQASEAQPGETAAHQRSPVASRDADRIAVSPAPASACLCPGSAIPEFRRDLFVAVPDSRAILRVRVDSVAAPGPLVTESLFAGQLGRIAVVACAPDGSLYVATREPSMEQAQPDRILRITGRTPSP